MKIVITGAAGAIGSHLAERLHALGHEVVGIDVYTSYYNPDIKRANAELLKAQGIDTHVLNLAHDDLSSVCAGADIIVHLAGQPGISSATPFQEYLDNNILATERLLTVAESLPTLTHFINGSTSSVYGVVASGDETTEPRPTSYYGVTKLAAEQLVMARARQSRFPGTSLRFFSVYGERERPDKFFMKVIAAAYSDTEVPLHEGSEHHVRSYTYVGDIIDGIVATIDRREATIGEIINLGTDVTSTTGEGLRIVEELVGKKLRIHPLPPRPGDQKETAANIAKARRLLNYNPTTTLKDGLARQVAWYDAQVKK